MSDQDDRRRPPPRPPAGGNAEPFRPQETELLPKLRRSAAAPPQGQPPSPWGEPPATNDPVRQAIAFAAEEPTAFELDVLDAFDGLGPAGEVTHDEARRPAASAEEPFPTSDATELLQGAGWEPSLAALDNAFDQALSGPFPAPPPPAAEVPAAPAVPVPDMPPSASPGESLTGIEISVEEPEAAFGPALGPASEPAIAAKPRRSRLTAIAAGFGGLLLVSAGAIAGLHFTGLVAIPGIGLLDTPSIAAAPTLPPAVPEAPAKTQEAAPAETAPAEAKPADEKPAEPAIAEAESAAAPKDDPEDGPEVDLEAAAEPKEAPEDLEPDAEPVISPKWKKKRVYVGIARVRDQSDSGVSRLDRNLKDGFRRALAQDDHARWKVLSRRVRRGHVVYLDVTEVKHSEPAGALEVEVACQASAWAKPGKSEKVVREARAQARVEGRPTPLLRDQLTRDATRSCAASLSQRFVLAALR